jgi:hypothetical protein
MHVFWYQSEKILPDGWTKVFWQTEQKSQKFRAYIKIIGYSHQIDLYFQDRQLCEALTTQEPSVHTAEFLLLNLANNDEYIDTNLRLWASANLAEVDNFLEQTNVVKYDFGQGAWTAVQLTENQNLLFVRTLHCYPELNLVVWSQTKYHL